MGVFSGGELRKYFTRSHTQGVEVCKLQVQYCASAENPQEPFELEPSRWNTLLCSIRAEARRTLSSSLIQACSLTCTFKSNVNRSFHKQALKTVVNVPRSFLAGFCISTYSPHSHKFPLTATQKEACVCQAPTVMVES